MGVAYESLIRRIVGKAAKKIDALKVKIRKEKQLELNMQLKNYGEN